MQSFLDFLNNNTGLVAILGVIVGWLLSSASSKRLYERQKKDAIEKERREIFSQKAVLYSSCNFKAKTNNIRRISAVMCSYEATLNSGGEVDVILPKEIGDYKNLKRKVIYLENIGKSDINALEVAVASPKHAALILVSSAKTYAKEGSISYGVSDDRTIRPGEALELTLYYIEKDPVINFASATLEVYYHDSLNNICAQPFFPEQAKMYPPRAIEYSEWRDQVNVDKNLEFWKERLNRK